MNSEKESVTLILVGVHNIRKNSFYCVGDQTRAKVAQRGRGVCLLGDTQKSSGHGPQQAAWLAFE